MATRIRRIIPFSFLLSLTIVVSSAGAQVLDREQMEELSGSVVKIFAEHDNNREITATGFIYGDEASVVTSFHVVSGAQRVQVKFSSGGSLVAAEVVRVIKKQDLALLELKKPSARTPLVTSASASRRGDRLLCLGYPFNIPTIDDTLVTVKTLGKKLKDIIPPNVKKDLDDIGFPDTLSEIINLDGHLLPGHSGAPLFNDDGRIVAVSNGGLAVGAASRSWAIDASHLKSLLASTENIPNSSAASSHLFAEELPQRLHRTILEDESSGEKLLFVREASFRELLLTTDDPLGLQQIASTFFGIDPGNSTYRIYRELDSGATLVVPTDMDEPVWADEMWQSSSRGDLVSLYFRVDRAANPNDLQRRSQSFEVDIVEDDDQRLWVPDFNWTYPFPRPTYQGMTVRRLAYVKMEGLYSPIQTKQLIVTFSAANSLLLSAAAKLNDNNALFGSISDRDRWFQGATAAFLTTIGN